MKKRNLIITFLFTTVVGMLLPIIAMAAESAIYTTFDPEFNYLESGQASIVNLGDGSIGISGETNATQYVSTIGIQLVVQRWDGSVWQDYYQSPDYTLPDETYIYVSDKLTVPTGYYYRIRSIHWATENGVTEQGDRYTSSILIN